MTTGGPGFGCRVCVGASVVHWPQVNPKRLLGGEGLWWFRGGFVVVFKKTDLLAPSKPFFIRTW